MKNKLKFLGAAVFGLLVFGFVALSLTGCDNGSTNGGGDEVDTRVELTAGTSPVNVAYDATTANATFNGASGLSLTSADFEVTGGLTITNVNVASDTATVTVGLTANPNYTPRSYTVSIKASSTLIKGSASVTITQAGKPDDRVELTASNGYSVNFIDTSAEVEFTGADSLADGDLTADDFTVTNINGAEIKGVEIDNGTVYVYFEFDENPYKYDLVYTVGINANSEIITGSDTITVTQGGNPAGIDERVELTAGSAVNVLGTATNASVTFTGAGTLTTSDFASGTHFTVDNDASIGTVTAASGTVTVTINFAANDSYTLPVIYTVGINSNSELIKGDAEVTVTQAPIEKSAGAAVSAPTLDSKTSNSITVNAATFTAGNPGSQTIEYGINTSNSVPSTWQDGLVFSSLSAETQYYIFARSKENATHNAGTPSVSLPVMTEESGKEAGALVSQPTLVEKSYRHIEINASTFIDGNPGYQYIEYAISTSNIAPLTGWSGSRAYYGLDPVTTYYIFARSEENATHSAGMPSYIEVTTDKADGGDVSIPQLDSKTDTTITIYPCTIYGGTGQTVEYGISTSNDSSTVTAWQDGLTFSGLTANTQYYIFARAKENETHLAGTPNSYSLSVKTDSDIVVTISPSSGGVAAGGQLQFTATVTGTGSPAQTVTWTVSGSTDPTMTTISTSGLLTVSGWESSYVLTVRATSTVDTDKSDTVTVRVVNATLTNIPDTWNSRMLSGGNIQWLMVTATDNTSYIHLDPSGLDYPNNGFFFDVFDSNFNSLIGGEVNVFGNFRNYQVSLQADEVYFIVLRQSSFTNMGNVRIAFNDSTTRPD